MDMYQKRKIMVAKKVFQKFPFRGTQVTWQKLKERLKKR